jgi:hypothetical protein
MILTLIKKYLINGKKCICLGIVLTITFKEKDNAYDGESSNTRIAVYNGGARLVLWL